jgi:hypothetical protein
MEDQTVFAISKFVEFVLQKKFTGVSALNALKLPTTVVIPGLS